MNKRTVCKSSQSLGIKYIMFFDNWGVYVSNGIQSGWQRDNRTMYMTFVTAEQNSITTILEEKNRYIFYKVYISSTELNNR